MKKNRIVLALCGLVFGTIVCPKVSSNLFSDVDLIGSTVRADGETVEINETNFPDDVFREYVRQFDKNDDSEFSQEELDAVVWITLGGGDRKATSLKGLEFFTKLTQLSCENASLTSLDVSNNLELDYLKCQGNKLTSLDVSKNTKLVNLYCGYNQLTELDVSNNPLLTGLGCSNNQISNLNLENNTKLNHLSCHDNPITYLDVRQCDELVDMFNNSYRFFSCENSSSREYFVCYNSNTYPFGSMTFPFGTELIARDPGLPTPSPISGSIKIDEKNFEDAYFRDLVTQFDTDHNQYLSPEEIQAVTEMSVGYGCIQSLKGLEFFTNLENLYCYGTKVKNLDLSGNKLLKFVWCGDDKNPGSYPLEQQLQTINIRENDKLESLYLCGNQLTSLDLSGNPKLSYLACSYNQLTELDISHCDELKKVYATPKSESDWGGYCYSLKDQEVNIYLEIDQSVRIITKDSSVTKTPTNSVTKTPTKTVTKTPTKTVTKTPTKSVTKTPTKMVTKAPTKAPTTVPANGTIGDFVERLYTVALNRASEKAGKDYWIDEITSGRRTGGDCAHYFLIDAPEFLNRKLSVEAFVETLYRTFFGRNSESAGKAYWVSEIKDGRKTRADVINGFIDSTEWCNICARYGVRSGAPSAKAEIPSPNAKGFATRLYTCCLGRDPEEGGLKYWSLALTNLEKTGAEAAKQFFESEEFQNMRTSNTEYVTRLYRTFMGREPETDGLNYWVGELVKGRSRLYVMAGFASSQEFTNICKKYGIERGEIIVSEKDKNAATVTPTPKVEKSIKINATNFPDSVFCEFVKQYDTDNNGWLSSGERTAVKTLDCHGKRIESLKGIEFFDKLTALYCYECLLSELDLSKCTNLEEVCCGNNYLEKLDVTNCSNLKKLNCYRNALASVNVSNNFALEELNCDQNMMQSLDVTKNPALIYLDCHSTQILSLDVTKNSKLIYLDCARTRLTKLDLSNNAELESLSCLGNDISTLDITHNTKLRTCYCEENKLSELDLSKNASLETLLCFCNKLTSLDVSKNVALKYLDCSQNEITSLNVSDNVNLNLLYCFDNVLTKLDLSKNSLLQELCCDKNYFTALDVSNNTKLYRLDCGDNYMYSIDLSNVPILLDVYLNGQKSSKQPNYGWYYFDGDKKGLLIIDNKVNVITEPENGVVINATNFPDVKFREYVKAFDGNRSGELSKKELADVTHIDVCEEDIASLKGIEYFTALTTLYCDCNNLASLDLTHNTKLTSLSCSENKLASLDLTHNTKLTYLNCYDNKLTSLDISRNTELTNLDCGDNELTSLNVSSCLYLKYLTCYYNSLKSLDVTNNPALEILECSSNQLTSLDVSRNPQLFDLFCDDNQLISLDVSQNTELTILRCDSNELTSLDVSNNRKLTRLECSQNHLTSLNVSRNPELCYFICYDNKIKQLNIGNCSELLEMCSEYGLNLVDEKKHYKCYGEFRDSVGEIREVVYFYVDSDVNITPKVT